jgi:ribosomal protein S18 acetylase RimI-like enzyme
MIERFSVTIEVDIRQCQPADLRKLEWFGMFTDYREIIEEAFERQENGEIVMLVAAINHFPVGQLWIDLVKQSEKCTGVLWSFRVLPPFQGLGLGSRLLVSAEKVLKEKGFRIAEIGVEKDNERARRLYERKGYRVVKENVEEWDYFTPNGKQVHEVALEWIMNKQL